MLSVGQLLLSERVPIVADEAKRLFVYTGPTPSERKTISSSPKMLSAENLHLIIVRAWLIGRYHLTDHFRTRGRQRGFDVLDAENAICSGNLRGSPEYCPDFSNWKCRILGLADSKRLEIVVALDEYEDYDESPLIIPITGYWR